MCEPDAEPRAAASPVLPDHAPVGVLGAGSFVARRLLPRLERAGRRPLAVRTAPGSFEPPREGEFSAAIALCPLWGLVAILPGLAEVGVRRLVAVSSASRFTKAASPDPAEREVAARLAAAEDAVGEWAAARGAAVTILRPTLVYDGVHDRNVTAIASFVRRFGVFPLVGAGHGLRQPLHADDLAAACVAALAAPGAGPAYDIAGGETLTYREMVRRIFASVGRRPRFVRIPRWGVRLLLPVVSRLTGRRDVSLAAFDRMEDPLVADNAAAARDLGFAPRPFEPAPREPA